MGMPSMPELLIILAIVVLLFGAKKIPELAKGMGSGIRNFKKAMKEDEEEELAAAKKAEQVEQKSEAAAGPRPKRRKRPKGREGRLRPFSPRSSVRSRSAPQRTRFSPPFSESVQ